MAGGCPFSFGGPKPCSFVVQISDQAATSPDLPELDFRITVTNGARVSHQTLTDAAVSILHLPSASASSSSAPVLASAILCDYTLSFFTRAVA